jgi:hypothetical protein
MDLFWIIVIAFGFFIFGFLTTLIAVDNDDGLMQRAIVSGLLSSFLFFLIIDIYDKL